LPEGGGKIRGAKMNEYLEEPPQDFSDNTWWGEAKRRFYGLQGKAQKVSPETRNLLAVGIAGQFAGPPIAAANAQLSRA